jgi:hypothetical protein
MPCRNSTGLAAANCKARKEEGDDKRRLSKLSPAAPQAPAPWRKLGDVTAVVLRKIFRERCEARAILYEAAELSLHEAIDVLQDDAKRTGLVGMLGQAAVQAIIAEAFARPQYVYRLLIGPVELADLACRAVGSRTQGNERIHGG